MIPAQCRMARAALRLGLRELAAAAKVSTNTVTRFERGEKLHERTVDAIRSALESAGIYFTNGDRPGVSLRPRGDYR
jgi:transcriptional regulator with XRE-family HTH domain